MLYSDDLKIYQGEISPIVSEAIQDIKKYFNRDDLKIYVWDTFNIAVAAEFEISLPSRGSIDNLILCIEPILIKISLAKYPERAPTIMSDRKNFPKNRLPHLYYSADGKPAVLCLVRANLNQWFSTVTMADFLLVGSQWFYKAASGTLLKDNDEFDPVRLENNTSGKHIFKYETFRDIVIENNRFVSHFPMALILSCIYESQNSYNETFKSITAIPFVTLEIFNNSIKQVFTKIFSSKDSIKVLPLYSLLVWDNENLIENYYSTNLPTTYGELKIFLNLKGIDIESMILNIEELDIKFRFYLPIIHTVNRPKKVIGYDGNYEFFTYLIDLPDEGIIGLNDQTKICIASHSEPFSSKIATMLSNEKREANTLYVGAGSLGSKILMHDARIGKMKMGVVDNDKFEQHNLGRHVLYSNKVGKNKAEAMIDEVKGFYTLDTTSDLLYYDKYVSDLEDADIDKYSLIIDSTASQQVLQFLTLRNLNKNSIYTRCELVDDGELGLLYVEGKDRNPRMDDLVNYTCFLATKNPDLKLWRLNDAKREPDTLNIGLGCNSITTIMPDDLISFHASTFSQILASYPMESFSGKGLIYLNISRKKNGFPKISNEYIEVEPFEIFECQNNSGWSLRLFSGLSNILLQLCKQYGRQETGGVLVGVANYKTKIIHVFDVIEQPIDSEGTPVAFTRGITGLPKQIDDIKLQTGEVIGYIGEWHTHPMNLEKLSMTDLKTIEKLKEINKKTPIPTCAIIVTQKKIIPFVFN
ncbi:ThiF family adenylyltransferase [Flavobacterium sp.]|uniref:ThiF family adenylyltransferase n=1 Tax=Flavobacterium sp. TaxID=239 RepID=UPI002FD9B20B